MEEAGLKRWTYGWMRRAGRKTRKELEKKSEKRKREEDEGGG